MSREFTIVTGGNNIGGKKGSCIDRITPPGIKGVLIDGIGVYVFLTDFQKKFNG